MSISCRRSLWDRAAAAGLELTIIDGHVSLEVGFNDRAQHPALTGEVRENMALARDCGARLLAVNAGNRGGVSDADAVGVCAEGLAPLAAEADQAWSWRWSR